MYKKQNILILILFFAIIILGLEASNLQKQVQENDSENAQIQILLTGDNKVAGFTCGALNTEKAKSLLNSKSVDKAFSQGPKDEVKQGESNPDNIFWSDSCRYEDSANSTKYVEMFISTFQSDELAKSVFLDFIPEVNSKENIPPGNYGQELIYDSGVYYLLQNNRVVQIAASNGNPAETESFSLQVFKDLLPDTTL